MPQLEFIPSLCFPHFILSYAAVLGPSRLLWNLIPLHATDIGPLNCLSRTL